MFNSTPPNRRKGPDPAPRPIPTEQPYAPYRANPKLPEAPTPPKQPVPPPARSPHQ